MANIRQRKTDPSPASRGVHRKEEEFTQIVIEPEPDEIHFDSRYHSPRAPRMIPDKHYKDFLLGRSSKRKEPSMLPDGRTCAGRCIAFSWVAVAFLFWAGLLIDTQPIFIKGVQPKGDCRIEGVTYNVPTEHQRLPSSRHAYQAGFAYLFTILLCVAYRRNWIQSAVARIRRYKRQHYQDIPDHDDSNAKGLPMFHMAQNAYTANPSNELWNRMVVFLKNFAKKWSKSPVRNKRRRE